VNTTHKNPWLIPVAIALAVELLLAMRLVSAPEAVLAWVEEYGISWSPSFAYLASLAPDAAHAALYLFVTALSFPLKVLLAASILDQLPPKTYAQFIISPRYRMRTPMVEWVAGAPVPDQKPLAPYGPFGMVVGSLLEIGLAVGMVVSFMFAMDGIDSRSGGDLPLAQITIRSFKAGSAGVWFSWSLFYAGVTALLVAAACLVIRDYSLIFARFLRGKKRDN